MNNKAVVTVIAILALALALPVVAKYARPAFGQYSPPASTNPIPAQAAAPATAATPSGPIDTTNLPALTGSKWLIQGYTLELQAGGAVSASRGGQGKATTGTWSVNGPAVTISVGGRSFTPRYEDGKLTLNGVPLQKVN